MIFRIQSKIWFLPLTLYLYFTSTSCLMSCHFEQVISFSSADLKEKKLWTFFFLFFGRNDINMIVIPLLFNCLWAFFSPLWPIWTAEAIRGEVDVSRLFPHAGSVLMPPQGRLESQKWATVGLLGYGKLKKGAVLCCAPLWPSIILPPHWWPLKHQQLGPFTNAPYSGPGLNTGLKPNRDLMCSNDTAIIWV